jgi:hypothetical protein
MTITQSHLLPAGSGARHHGRVGAVGWQWTDAWIFVATVIAERLERDRAAAVALPVSGATLADVLAAAAFLHHGLPDRGDLEGSVRRLAGAGLITVDDDMVEVAPAGEQLWRTRPFRGLSSAVVTMQTQLNRVASPGEFPWSLDDETYATALREYRRRDGR